MQSASNKSKYNKESFSVTRKNTKNDTNATSKVSERRLVRGSPAEYLRKSDVTLEDKYRLTQLTMANLVTFSLQIIAIVLIFIN